MSIASPEQPQARAWVRGAAARLDDEDDDTVREVVVTFFTDHTANTKREQRLTLTALAELIHSTAANDKARLPWLKLARFGDRRTKGGALRNNDNVVSVSGVEGDYDAKQMSLADAKDILASSGICAIIYPSPSYTPTQPKWRVLCPFSTEYPPADRDRFMARLHGMFDGRFDPASWTLSQSYYFGRVANPDHHATIFDGVPIDLADWLDATAIARPKERGVGRQPHPKSRPEDISEARVQSVVHTLLGNLRAASDGTKHFTLRDNCLALGGYLHMVGWSAEEAVEQALGALPSADDWDQARHTAEWAISRGMERPIELEDRRASYTKPVYAVGGADADSDGAPPPHEPSPQPDTTRVWPEPVDCFVDPSAAPAVVTAEEAPPALWPFIHDTAERMGVATSTVTLAALVTCSAVISDQWQLQPKRFDYTWTEAARLWGAIVGPPSILKTPALTACTRPVDRLESEGRKQWQEDMARHEERHAAWKQAKDKNKDSDEPEPQPPRRPRWLVESATVEALQEVLRDDEGAKFEAPASKVLVRQDELSEFIANLDRYTSGKSGGDRGAYLRLYNGGPFSVDRIGRGSFTASNWSGCLLGGIQPEPIQRSPNSRWTTGCCSGSAMTCRRHMPARAPTARLIPVHSTATTA